MVNLGLSRVDDAVANKHPQVAPGRLPAVLGARQVWRALRLCPGGPLASPVDELADGDHGSWQAQVRPSACRCSFGRSFRTPFSGTCWWPWSQAQWPATG
ncbi:transmembrane protein 141 isoform X2 [Hippopotamus amphibius kiboko]|uniref:transmembrane protein 141 isoform X2 n=1 Tax=Hippopotamus amphibius kiboko TaxID=575201 RepID=UPI002591C4C9|nr:transmembrane protein 141 isoform X2 [Hippopotamus amphibius kiboko]